MNIFGKNEANFDFKVDSSSSKYEVIKLTLVHFLPQVMLPRDAKNIYHTYSFHRFDDDEDINGQSRDKKMVGKI
jgi:hypothetical protein